MHLQTADWIIIISYFVFALFLGLYYTKRAGQSVDSFFLAGRSLPWWWVGLSMAATTFAADTPLAITEIIRTQGIWGNWLWWCWGIGWVVASVWIAPLWRRSEVITDAEFLSLRYERNADSLRMFTAVYFGIILNVIIIGWVVGAMSTILAVVTGWDVSDTAFFLMLFALVYSASSGLWGVIATDLFQFFFAFGGTVLFALLLYDDVVADWAGILTAIESLTPGKLDIIPSGESFVWGFVFFLVVQWWAYYQSSLNIYFAQRLGATQTPADAERAGLLFNVLNFSVRHWPWVIVAIISLYLYPTEQAVMQELSDLGITGITTIHQAAYPLLMLKLPAGVLGLVLMGFLAAFMSTIDTHLNWGASYIARDIWPALRGKEDISVKESIWVSRLAMVMIFAWAMLIIEAEQSVVQLWSILFGLTAGLGLVYYLRWFWYRINAATELACMAAGFSTTVVFILIGDDLKPVATAFGAGEYFGTFKLAAITFISVLTTLVTALATKPDRQVILEAFVAKVQPPVWLEPGRKIYKRGLVMRIAAGLMVVYGVLLATYNLFFVGLATAVLWTAVAGAGVWLLHRSRLD